MADMLRYYNNLDVAPFLQAIEVLRQWWIGRDIDMFKQAFSLPGLALIDILKTKAPHSAFVLPGEANSDFYRLVKEQIVGGPSIVFTRYHERGKTRIRDRERGKPCCGIIGCKSFSFSS